MSIAKVVFYHLVFLLVFGIGSYIWFEFFAQGNGDVAMAVGSGLGTLLPFWIFSLILYIRGDISKNKKKNISKSLVHKITLQKYS